MVSRKSTAVSGEHSEIRNHKSQILNHKSLPQLSPPLLGQPSPEANGFCALCPVPFSAAKQSRVGSQRLSDSGCPVPVSPVARPCALCFSILPFRYYGKTVSRLQSPFSFPASLNAISQKSITFANLILSIT